MSIHNSSHPHLDIWLVSYRRIFSLSLLPSNNFEFVVVVHNVYFYLQISVMVAKDAEMHKSKLNYFMKQFYSIIRKMDSSNKELSIAIRGYGLFAAVCNLLV